MSGSGKTTFTMGLLRLLNSRGLNVQPFKCGPDYIDTQFHSLASGNQSVNLDTWMSSEQHVKNIYSLYGAMADVCVVEGVMGLFDGSEGMKGSSADIARIIDVPVVLVINARSMAYSVAPLIYGFKNFDQRIRIAGVVFNQVSSASHYNYLQKACDDIGVECFGYLPKSENMKVPSRHLGLTLMVRRRMNRLVDEVAGIIREHVDVDRMLNACSCKISPRENDGQSDSKREKRRMKIAVASDASFNFVYRVNIDRLRDMGEVVFFSPLKDDVLPVADLVYLPGGYPELFAYRLQRHKGMMDGLRKFAMDGGRILAECGGMMYLTDSITTGKNGKKYPMCGVLPFNSTLSNARLHLGYRSMDYGGVVWKGHEFHYSEMERPHDLPSIAMQKNAKGGCVDTPIYRYKNVIASYTHWYWGENDILKLWE